ncbi:MULTISPECIES: hypothetical protein [unclassified Streptomyces]|uniref:hypothetical protein n=1 Tax=unclassified Streptomyces TaxID=2593676 RepID=UPI002475673D|nr:hypothetical protein [Streptomyces sp. SAI-119]MDH6455668.1 hypothetical protein [Streptomyces sp. SAI-119]
MCSSHRKQTPHEWHEHLTRHTGGLSEVFLRHLASYDPPIDLIEAGGTAVPPAL